MSESLKTPFVLMLLMMSKVRAAVAPKQWMRDGQPHKQV
jgi:hypothetical protein